MPPIETVRPGRWEVVIQAGGGTSLSFKVIALNFNYALALNALIRRVAAHEARHAVLTRQDTRMPRYEGFHRNGWPMAIYLRPYHRLEVN